MACHHIVTLCATAVGEPHFAIGHIEDRGVIRDSQREFCSKDACLRLWRSDHHGLKRTLARD